MMKIMQIFGKVNLIDICLEQMIWYILMSENKIKILNFIFSTKFTKDVCWITKWNSSIIGSFRNSISK